MFSKLGKFFFKPAHIKIDEEAKIFNKTDPGSQREYQQTNLTF